MSGYHVKMGYHMPTWEAMIYKWYGEKQAVQTGIPPTTIFVEKRLILPAIKSSIGIGITCSIAYNVVM